MSGRVVSADTNSSQTRIEQGHECCILRKKLINNTS